MAINIAGISIRLKDESEALEFISAAAEKAARECAYDIFRARAKAGGYGIDDVDSKIEAIAAYLLDNYHISNERA